MEGLPNPASPIDCYDHLLQTLFPEFQIVNITEFDYGRSYRHVIFLSGDADAALLQQSALLRAVERTGSIDSLNLAISAVSPYFLINFTHYSDSSTGLVEQHSATPSNFAQRLAGEKLESTLSALGFSRLSESVAAQIVPDVATDLCDFGAATVADCLFFG